MQILKLETSSATPEKYHPKSSVLESGNWVRKTPSFFFLGLGALESAGRPWQDALLLLTSLKRDALEADVIVSWQADGRWQKRVRLVDF